MNQIKFSHEYNKFFGVSNKAKVKLLQLFVVDHKQLSKDFIVYDTTTTKGTHYELPKGKLIVLLFYSTDTSSAFTTIRRWTPGKEKYYQSKVGNSFELVIE